MSRPTMDDLLSDIAGAIMETKAHQLPAQIQHARPRESAQWLLGILSCGQAIPGPRKIGRGKNAHWDWPERTHYATLAQHFLALEHDFQRYVIAAAEDGIQWRGDSEVMFRHIVAETERMWEVGVAEYRRQAREQLQRFCERRV